MRSLAVLGAALAVLTAQGAKTMPKPVIIGSKAFTESYVLAEIAKRVVEKAGLPVELRPGMGGTIILWEALRQGAITCYPEYTGTLQEVILRTPQVPESGRTDDLEALRRALARYGIGMTGKLGFNNTYALVMRRARAQALGIHQISDLKGHTNLVVGLGHEFLGRADGWNPLCVWYGLHLPHVRALDHSLAYLALAKGEIDVTDAYSTDPKITGLNLVILRDDRHFFPGYEAVFLYRMNADPRLAQALDRLAGTLDESRMTQLNATAERTHS